MLGNTEDEWSDIFCEERQDLSAADCCVYSRRQRSGGCGTAQSAMGPFYCPSDQKVYLDTSFFREIETRFQAAAAAAVPVRAGLCDRARGRPSRAEPARHPAEGASSSSRRREARRGESRCRSRSNCRPIASPASGPTTRTQQQWNLPGARRRRGGVANRRRDRRRHAAEAGAGLCGAGLFHPRHLGAAPALVQRTVSRAERSPAAIRSGPRSSDHASGGFREAETHRVAHEEAPWPASTRADNSCRCGSRC